MDVLLFLLGAALLLTAGFGAAVLALGPRPQVALGELAALAVLLGTSFVTLLWWGVCVVLPGFSLRGTAGMVAASSLVLGALGAARWRRWRPRLVGVGLFCGLALPLAAAVAAVAAARPFEWDGLVAWEHKAQAIVVEGGVPWRYLHDDSRAWSHPVYPLLVPFFRAWFYVWMGGVHEAMSQAASALFVLAAAGLLISLAPRFGTATSVLALAFCACTPLLMVGPGSATSGYADFPLAVYYLGVLFYLLDAGEDPRALRTAGCLAAALPWIKQEGAVLFVCLVAVAFLTLGSREWRRLPWLAGPGAAVWIAWRVFTVVTGVRSAQVFEPPSLGLLLARLHLWRDIGGAVLRLSFAPGLWGGLWVLFLFAAALPSRALDKRRSLLLALAVLAPLPVLVLPYFFSRWVPVTAHVESSFSRLLLQLSLPAIVLIAAKTAALISPGSPRMHGHVPLSPRS